MNNKNLLCAIDLGSNSFRLSIAKYQLQTNTSQLQVVQKIKETVRLAAGLNEEHILANDFIEKAIDVLGSFSNEIKALPLSNIRCVATNTFRIARNSNEILKLAEQALGVPIEIISGEEEARLIYLGVINCLPISNKRRLVVDIGGSSSEFIIGQGKQTLRLTSLDLGCVRLTQSYFPKGQVSQKGFEQALQFAESKILPIKDNFHQQHFVEALGSSGTAKALIAVLKASQISAEGITLDGLEQLKNIILDYGSAYSPKLLDIKPHRIEVFPAGLVIMLAIFNVLKIKLMHQGNGALRQGILSQLLHDKLNN